MKNDLTIRKLRNTTDLDEVAYQEYVKETKINEDVSKYFLNRIEDFARYHRRNDINLSTYYDRAKITLRKIKLNKLNTL